MDATLFERETRYERVTRWIGIFLLAPVLLLLAIESSVHIAQAPYLGMAVNHLVVAAVHADGPAQHAGVQRGDKIVAFDGQPVEIQRDWYRLRAGRYDLNPRVLIVERGAESRALTIEPTRQPRDFMVWSYSIWLAGLAFLLMGWWVLAKRHDPVARNFFAFSLIFAAILVEITDRPSNAFLTGKEILLDVLQLLLPVFFLRFLLLFPSMGRRSREDRRHLRMILLPPLLLVVLLAAVHLIGVRETPRSLLAAVETGALVLFVVYFVAGLVVFARKALRRDRRIQQTKMRVVLGGLVIGLTPVLVALLFGNLTTTSTIPHWEYLGFSLLLVPTSFGLAIMRYGALDTAFVVRSSLIYGLLTLLVLCGYFVVVGVVGHLLTSTFDISTWPLAIFIIAASSLAVLPLRRIAQRWIDRAFYPERLANRAAVVRLGDELTGIIERQAAVDLLLHRLGELYRPRTLALFLGSDKETELVEIATRRDGLQQSAERRLPVASPLARYLDEIRRPVFTEEFEDFVAGTGTAPDPTALAVARECELLLPLISGNRLVGFIGFGPKTGGDLYSQEDLANLRNLGLQVASLLESRRLYQESLARQQFETELAVAREIQAQLLPTDPLVRGSTTLCGRNEPCRAVGGDYFDYFELAPGKIGLCIADVAGKGIPAALLMSTVRVSFRTEATAEREPERVIDRLNRAVSEILASGQFVCFFYGIYDTESRVLTYCNAGMDPPLLIRRDGVLERLKKGGPVLGILTDHDYRRGTVKLHPRDLLALYTDGITDQCNADGEFFDEERLIAALCTDGSSGDGGRGLADLLGAVFASVAAFGGEERSDDRTVMLLRSN